MSLKKAGGCMNSRYNILNPISIGNFFLIDMGGVFSIPRGGYGPNPPPMIWPLKLRSGSVYI